MREGSRLLTRNHRQEALSRAYVQAIAAQAGLGWCLPNPDYGIDISLRAIDIIGNRRTDASVPLDIQLKSTTRASVNETRVAYDLSVDNYDDLRALGIRPRILVVLILPGDETLWVTQSSEELTIRHCAYWISLEGWPATPSVRSVRVDIPLTNVFSVAALQDIMRRLGERNQP
jgi:Domain of unknown function (DUF4365)